MGFMQSLPLWSALPPSSPPPGSEDEAQTESPDVIRAPVRTLSTMRQSASAKTLSFPDENPRTPSTSAQSLLTKTSAPTSFTSTTPPPRKMYRSQTSQSARGGKDAARISNLSSGRSWCPPLAPIPSIPLRCRAIRPSLERSEAATDHVGPKAPLRTAKLTASTQSSRIPEHMIPTAIPPVKKRPVSDFFGLPPELRNTIYTCAIASHDRRNPPNLINTCKLARKEALELFYDTHFFPFDAIGPIHLGHNNRAERDLWFWTEKIGKKLTNSIRHLRFRISTEEPRLDTYNSEKIIHLDVTVGPDSPCLKACRFSQDNVDPDCVKDQNERMAKAGKLRLVGHE